MVQFRVAKLSVSQRIDRWMINEGGNRLFMTFFILGHVLVFAFSFLNFLLRDNQRGPRGLMGITYPIARAAANVLHFDVACILLPICRNLVSFLRNTPLGSILPLDKNITFHKFIGWSIVLFSGLHTIAHWNNFAQIARKEKLGVSGFFKLNFSTGPGLTGYFMLIVLGCMAYTAMEKRRRQKFERI